MGPRLRGDDTEYGGTARRSKKSAGLPRRLRRLAAAIADRPMTGGLAQFQQRQPLAHRHHIVMGDRIGLDLDLEGMSERGVAARNRTRHAHHVLRGTWLALARRGR